MGNQKLALELISISDCLLSIKLQTREVNAAIAIVECTNRLSIIVEQLQKGGNQIENHNQQTE